MLWAWWEGGSMTRSPAPARVACPPPTLQRVMASACLRAADSCHLHPWPFCLWLCSCLLSPLCDFSGCTISTGILIVPSVDSTLFLLIPKLPMQCLGKTTDVAESDGACLLTNANGKVHIPWPSFCLYAGSLNTSKAIALVSSWRAC